MNLKNAENLLEKHSITINSNSLEKILKFYNFMLEENKKYNVASIKDETVFFEKNIVDSLMILKVFPDLKGSMIDIGSGNGLPGFVLKSVFENLELTLIDSELKKIKFLEKVNQNFFKDVNILHGRAEEYFKKSKVKFDFVAAKALVSKPDRWVRWTVPFANEGGYIINYKTKKFLDEINISNVKSYLKSKKVTLEKTFDYSVEGSDRTLVIFKKRGKNEV